SPSPRGGGSWREGLQRDVFSHPEGAKRHSGSSRHAHAWILNDACGVFRMTAMWRVSSFESPRAISHPHPTLPPLGGGGVAIQRIERHESLQWRGFWRGYARVNPTCPARG